MELEGVSGQFASPNYPGDYPNDAFCTYSITVPEGYRVALRLDVVDLEGPYGGACAWDAIQVDQGDGVQVPLEICGNDVPDGEIISLSNSMVVTFTSDSIISSTGFAATYTAVAVDTNTESPNVDSSCYNTVDEDSGVLESPWYPNKYPRRRVCVYTITAPEGSRVELEFEGEIGIEYHNRCIWDFLEVHLGDGITTPLRLCGDEAPEDSLISLENEMCLVFRSDRSVRDDGFQAKFRTVTVTPSVTVPLANSDESDSGSGSK